MKHCKKLISSALLSLALSGPLFASCQLVVHVKSSPSSTQELHMTGINMDKGTHERSEGNINLIKPGEEANAWLSGNVLSRAYFEYTYTDAGQKLRKMRFIVQSELGQPTWHAFEGQATFKSQPGSCSGGGDVLLTSSVSPAHIWVTLLN